MSFHRFRKSTRRVVAAASVCRTAVRSLLRERPAGPRACGVKSWRRCPPSCDKLSHKEERRQSCIGQMAVFPFGWRPFRFVIFSEFLHPIPNGAPHGDGGPTPQPGVRGYPRGVWVPQPEVGRHQRRHGFTTTPQKPLQTRCNYRVVAGSARKEFFPIARPLPLVTRLGCHCQRCDERPREAPYFAPQSALGQCLEHCSQDQGRQRD